jgi:hypothetical protein
LSTKEITLAAVFYLPSIIILFSLEPNKPHNLWSNYMDKLFMWFYSKYKMSAFRKKWVQMTAFEYKLSAYCERWVKSDCTSNKYAEIIKFTFDQINSFIQTANIETSFVAEVYYSFLMQYNILHEEINLMRIRLLHCYK